MVGAECDQTARSCAVVGSPISHSLSPVLQTAAYADLGLTSWRYVRREVRAGELAQFATKVANEGIDALPVGGLSVTMPGKREAMALADHRTDTVIALGAANTLVPVRDGQSVTGWSAFNTDVAGVSGALWRANAGVSGNRDAVVIGCGSTAAAALLGLNQLGHREVSMIGRDRDRASATLAAADQLGISVCWVPWTRREKVLAAADLVVSTLPAGIADCLVGTPWRSGLIMLDAVYAGGETAMMSDAARSGAWVIGGRSMLLHQAVEQVQLMTGHLPNIHVMRTAIEAA